MRTAGEVQRMVAAVIGGEFPQVLGRRYPAPAPEPLVEVVALSDRWCMGGQPVTVGERYRLPRTEAATLEHLNKARPA